MLSQRGRKSWSSRAAVGEGLDVVPLPHEEKSQTQKGDEKGGTLIIVPGRRGGFIQQQFTD